MLQGEGVRWVFTKELSRIPYYPLPQNVTGLLSEIFSWDWRKVRLNAAAMHMCAVTTVTVLCSFQTHVREASNILLLIWIDLLFLDYGALNLKFYSARNRQSQPCSSPCVSSKPISRFYGRGGITKSLTLNSFLPWIRKLCTLMR